MTYGTTMRRKYFIDINMLLSMLQVFYTPLATANHALVVVTCGEWLPCFRYLVTTYEFRNPLQHFNMFALKVSGQSAILR